MVSQHADSQQQNEFEQKKEKEKKNNKTNRGRYGDSLILLCCTIQGQIRL